MRNRTRVQSWIFKLLHFTPFHFFPSQKTSAHTVRIQTAGRETFPRSPRLSIPVSICLLFYHLSASQTAWIHYSDGPIFVVSLCSTGSGNIENSKGELGPPRICTTRAPSSGVPVICDATLYKAAQLSLLGVV